VATAEPLQPALVRGVRIARVQRVRLYLDDGCDDCFVGGQRTTQNVEAATKRLVITLAPKDFSRDVTILRYAGDPG
jgi:hypothetical protein